MKLGDLEFILIAKEIKLNILNEKSRHFYLDIDTGEYKEKNGTFDMYDLYKDYQVDRIYEGEGQSLTIDIRYRTDLYGKKK